MRSLITKQAERFLRERKNYKRWLAAFLCLAVMVVLGTVMVLRYTGTAMTGDPQCGLEEHVHTEECYQENLICGKEAEEGHEHTAECYEKQLVCGMEEHTHADACYEKDEEITVEMDAQAVGNVGEAAPAEEGSAEAGTPAENNSAEAGNPAGENAPEEGSVADTGETTAPAEEGTGPVEPAEDKNLSDEMNLVQTAESENYRITVTYSESAEIPEGAVLRVIEYAKDSAAYDERCAQLGYQPDDLLNVGFFLNDSEIEPKKPVDVKIKAKNVTDEIEYRIGHFKENDEIEKIITEPAVSTGDGVEMEFTLESFCDIAVYGLERQEENPKIELAAPISGLSHEKKIEYKDQSKGIYELTLNVKGAIATSDDKAKLDIIFVVDTSGSMAFDIYGNERGEWGYDSSKVRRKLVKEQITELVGQLGKDTAIDAKYKLITFASNSSTRGAGTWLNGSELLSKLPDSASGGTNYQDALEDAAAAVNTKRDGSKTIVFFLTDGAPTYYNRGNGLGGSGSSTSVTTVNKSAEGARNITDACDYFFAIGFGQDMIKDTEIGSSGMTAREILDKIANSTSAKEKSASAVMDLSLYFKDFQEDLKKIIAKNVSFTDRLTSEVYIVDSDGTKVENPAGGNWKIEITDAAGNILGTDDTISYVRKNLTDAEKQQIDAALRAEKARVSVTYDATAGLRASISDNEPLKNDWTYAVKTLIKTNDTVAGETYKNSGYTYPDKGEPGTGKVSENADGFFSNEEGSAKLTYSYEVNGVVKEHDPTDPDLLYPRPVVTMKKTPESSTTPSLPDVDQELGHRKYVKKVEGENDNYDLTLDVTGRVGHSQTGSGKYDILFIVDTSGSMRNSVTINGKAQSRMDHAKDAIKKMIDIVSGKGVTVEYNVVSFGTGYSSDTKASDWKTKENIINDVNSLKAVYNTGTNYQAGLYLGGKQLIGREDNDAEKVVIFLTDGEPSHGLFATDWWGNVTGVDNDGEVDDLEQGLLFSKDYSEESVQEGASFLKGKCHSFYAIGFGMKDSKYLDIAAKNAVTDESQRAVYTDETKDLMSIFEQIAGGIVSFNCSNVIITDTLSKWAEVNTAENGVPAKFEVKIFDNKKDPQEVLEIGATTYSSGDIKVDNADGNTVYTVELVLPVTDLNKKESFGEGEPKMTATYNPKTKKVDVVFTPAYQLESNMTYAVTIRINPTNVAYEEYAKENPSLNTGDVDTDDINNNTSSLQLGLYSNGSAKLNYKYDGGDDEKDYPKPVIQARPSTIKVTKTIKEGLTNDQKNALIEALRFSVDKETNIVLDQNTLTFTKQVAPGTHTVSEQWLGADIDGMSRKTSVKINKGEPQVLKESTASSGTDAEVSVITVAGAETTVEFINEYTSMAQNVWFHKVDSEGRSTAFSGKVEFQIREGSIDYDAINEEMDGAVEDETRQKVFEEELNKQLDAILAKDPKITTTVRGEGGIASLTEGLSAGSYIVSEVITDNELKNYYYTINPFELKVSDDGVVIEQITGLGNDADVIGPIYDNNGKTGTNGPGYEITVVNRKMQLDKLLLVKVSGENHTAVLDGAIFDLYRVEENGTEECIVADLETTGGLIEIPDTVILTVGTYRLYETKAPDGYNLPTEPFQFTIESVKDKSGRNVIVKPSDAGNLKIAHLERDDKGNIVYDEDEKVICQAHTDAMGSKYYEDAQGHKIWTLAVTNSTGKELPHAGGPGTLLYTFGGLAIVAIGLVYGLSMKRKKERGYQ